MSLASFIVQPQAAYLFTDSGFWHPGDATVLCLESKLIELPELDMALTTRGFLPYACLAREIEHRSPSSAADLIAALPDITFAAGTTNGIDLTKWTSAVYAIGFNRQAGRAYGLMMRTTEENLPAGMSPWQIAAGRYTVGEGIDLEAVLGTSDPCDPHSFDPERKGMKLVAAERAQQSRGWCADDWGDGQAQTWVAGDIRLTTASAAGVTTRLIHSYPDKAGERINPHG